VDGDIVRRPPDGDRQVFTAAHHDSFDYRLTAILEIAFH
jgi:hypothetical protein